MHAARSAMQRRRRVPSLGAAPALLLYLAALFGGAAALTAREGPCAPSALVAFAAALPSRGIPGAGALGCGRLGERGFGAANVARCCDAVDSLSDNRCLCAPEAAPLLREFANSFAAASAAAVIVCGRPLVVGAECQALPPQPAVTQQIPAPAEAEAEAEAEVEAMPSPPVLAPPPSPPPPAPPPPKPLPACAPARTLALVANVGCAELATTAVQPTAGFANSTKCCAALSALEAKRCFCRAEHFVAVEQNAGMAQAAMLMLAAAPRACGVSVHLGAGCATLQPAAIDAILAASPMAPSPAMAPAPALAPVAAPEVADVCTPLAVLALVVTFRCDRLGAQPFDAAPCCEQLALLNAQRCFCREELLALLDSFQSSFGAILEAAAPMCAVNIWGGPACMPFNEGPATQPAPTPQVVESAQPPPVSAPQRGVPPLRLPPAEQPVSPAAQQLTPAPLPVSSPPPPPRTVTFVPSGTAASPPETRNAPMPAAPESPPPAPMKQPPASPSPMLVQAQPAGAPPALPASPPPAPSELPRSPTPVPASPKQPPPPVELPYFVRRERPLPPSRPPQPPPLASPPVQPAAPIPTRSAEPPSPGAALPQKAASPPPSVALPSPVLASPSPLQQPASLPATPPPALRMPVSPEQAASGPPPQPLLPMAPSAVAAQPPRPPPSPQTEPPPAPRREGPPPPPQLGPQPPVQLPAGTVPPKPERPSSPTPPTSPPPVAVSAGAPARAPASPPEGVVVTERPPGPAVQLPRPPAFEPPAAQPPAAPVAPARAVLGPPPVGRAGGVPSLGPAPASARQLPRPQPPLAAPVAPVAPSSPVSQGTPTPRRPPPPPVSPQVPQGVSLAQGGGQGGGQGTSIGALEALLLESIERASTTKADLLLLPPLLFEPEELEQVSAGPAQAPGPLQAAQQSAQQPSSACAPALVAAPFSTLGCGLLGTDGFSADATAMCCGALAALNALRCLCAAAHAPMLRLLAGEVGVVCVVAPAVCGFRVIIAEQCAVVAAPTLLPPKRASPSTPPPAPVPPKAAAEHALPPRPMTPARAPAVPPLPPPPSPRPPQRPPPPPPRPVAKPPPPPVPRQAPPSTTPWVYSQQPRVQQPVNQAVLIGTEDALD